MDAYAWMKARLNSLFKLLTESIAKGVVGLDDLLSAIGSSHEMKLDDLELIRLINLAVGLIKLLEFA